METASKIESWARSSLRTVLRAGKRNLSFWTVYGLLLASSSIGGVGIGLAVVYGVDLPHIDDLESYRPVSDTLLYDDEGRLLATFATQHRVIAEYSDFPKVLYDAVLSIEDKDFEKHPGFETSRMVSAAYHDLVYREKLQGGSTLTMQLARNLFLSSERSYGRKIREIMLAIQIERRFTKSQIFTLYANQIYLGHGVYGFAAAAQFYFGKALKDLTLEEAAMLAALPKAPNSYSPIRFPERALGRRNLVIASMCAAGKISVQEAKAATSRPIRLSIKDDPNTLAPYFVEEVREYLERTYGTERVQEAGLRVYTTLNIDLQTAANRAVLDGLAAYERRHGWRVRLSNVRDFGSNPQTYRIPEWDFVMEPGTYVHAVVTSVSSGSASLRFGPYRTRLSNNDVAWTSRPIQQLLSVGDIAYIKVLSLGADFTARVRLEQEGGVQGALLAIDTESGEVKAMVGGRDFKESKFNRATQALRQVGSSFKPYVYTAAIDQGASPEDTIVDAPVVFRTPSGLYVPHNYDQKFEGTITLRHALAESRNIPALTLAESLGMKNVIDYARRFGISEPIPAYLPVALGAVELTLLEHTSAFSTFPNDGVRALPHYIRKVTTYDGQLVEQNYPVVHDVIGERTARVMTSMLREVVLHGTGAAARQLAIPVAGKTGTTNDFTDAWFVGFSRTTTCGVWIGFDQKISLGNKETGAVAALPIWMSFMKAESVGSHSIRDFPPVPLDRPPTSLAALRTSLPVTTGKSAVAPRNRTVVQIGLQQDR